MNARFFASKLNVNSLAFVHPFNSLSVGFRLTFASRCFRFQFRFGFRSHDSISISPYVQWIDKPSTICLYQTISKCIHHTQQHTHTHTILISHYKCFATICSPIAALLWFVFWLSWLWISANAITIAAAENRGKNLCFVSLRLDNSDGFVRQFISLRIFTSIATLFLYQQQWK